MASGSHNEKLHYQRRRYTVAELLVMGKTLPFVCCPVANFKPVAWTENILITVVPTSNPNEKHKARMIATKLGTHRPSNLINSRQEQEATERLVPKRKASLRGTIAKQQALATIPEVLTLKSIIATEALMQPVSLDYRLSGGYGKNIEIEKGQANNVGLTTSMHAFVPGGTLKTPPMTALNAGDLRDWEMGGNTLDHRMNTLSLADGLGLQRASSNAEIPPRASNLSFSTKQKLPAENGRENVRTVSMTTAAANQTVKHKNNLSSGTFLPTPRNLMNERSSGDEQRAWIDYMLARPIMSASRSAPQIKEPLGASIDDFVDPDRFKPLDDFYLDGIN
ncbi:hypothetical protein P167DRAFT_594845 [Morchella conica CCBAS932]|uniref:Uncharacterized protein n=1 Tax=Morchella conica CCBAS932 TaxID=1392247 RepID=A0A3N4KLA7_9PEZI|nr:hypothetical protein P167DRAFT_594845 [Morchella conica CCBAS932]